MLHQISSARGPDRGRGTAAAHQHTPPVGGDPYQSAEIIDSLWSVGGTDTLFRVLRSAGAVGTTQRFIALPDKQSICKWKVLYK